LAQDGVDVDVVVVNDGRSEPPPWVHDTGEGRVRVLAPDEHRGVGHARNTGIAAAEGEWIALLDDDDLWSPRKLAAQVDAAEAAGAAWSYTAGVYVDEELVPFQDLPAPSAEGLLAVLYRHQVIPGAASNLLVRSALLRELGGFDGDLHQLADWDLCLRLARSAPPAPVHDVLLAYVQHGSSMLVTTAASVLEEYDRFRAKHAADARSLGYAFDPESMAFWAVERLEKAGHRRRAARESLAAGVRYRETALLANAARLLVPRTVLAGPLVPSRVGTPHAPAVSRPVWLERYRLAAPV
jgi:GT2 family glycosyltransferase